MEKIKSFFRTRIASGVTLDKSKSKLGIGALAVAVAYIVALFISRSNFLAPIAVAFSAAAGVAIFLFIFIKGRINVFVLSAYPVLLGGTVLYFIIFGAEDFGVRLGYNLLISLAAIAVSAGLATVIFIKKDKGFKYIAAAALSFLLIASSVLYFLTMSIRVRPTVESLEEGHQNYLKEVSETAKTGNSPNVLFILMDDLGYADLSSYSYLGNENATIKTPNIDAIADDGVLMENFYTTSPVCSPSRFSILTGRYQSRGYLENVVFPTCVSLDPFGSTRYINPYQFPNNVDGILGDEITFAEALQAYDYNTACIGKWNLGDYGEYLPTNQGFDYFFGSYYVNDMTLYNIVRETGGVGTEVYSHYDLLDQSGSTRLFTDEMKSFINTSVDKDESFLAYYATPWPHYPIFSGEVGDVSDDNYIDCVEEFDSAVGEIIDLLKARGVYDDTIIVFTSDNGPGREGSTGSLRGRKNTVFDGGHKVPMLISYPNGDIGGSGYLSGTNVITASGSATDFFPTLLDYCGITVLPTDRIIDGVSLRPILSGDVPTDTVMHDVLYFIKGGKVQGVQAAVEVDGQTKIFKYYESVRTENSAFIDQVYKNYLFDITLDPIEAYNVSMKYPEVASAMLEKLKDFRAELKENRRGIIA